jgi:sugar-specific transcriptional regulator TrmB
MLFDVRTISMLQKLGLTLYGAKVYAALVSTGPTNATTLAREAEVPRTKIYETLKRLEEEKWVIVEKGRPSIYTPVYPREAIEDRKSTLYSEIDEVTDQLTMSYERQMEEENPKVWLIQGMDNIILKTSEMMGRAKHEIKLMGSLYSPREIEPLKKQILLAKKRGVDVRIITRPTIKSSEGSVDIVKSLLPVTSDIKKSKSPYIKNVIIDDREMLIMYSRVIDGVTDVDNVVAIWVSNAAVASYMGSNFDMMWNSKSPVHGER